MRLKKTKAALYLILAGVVLLLVVLGLTRSPGFGYAAIGMIVVYGVVHQIRWRCPKCSKSIGPLWVRHCPHCGEKLT